MEEHHQNSPKKRHKLKLKSDEKISNNYEIDQLVVSYESQAPERRLQPTIATSEEHTDASSSSSSTQISAGKPIRKRRHSSSPTPPNFNDKPTAPHVHEVSSDPLKPGDRTPVEFNPGERLSMGVINKCPECSRTATTNVTTHLRDPPNMSTTAAFKVVYSCKEPWCEELFALNSMWDVSVRAEDFRKLREDLEPETTKGLLHSCPKCLSTSTKFEYFRLFHTKVTTAKCWGCAHGLQPGKSHDGTL